MHKDFTEEDLKKIFGNGKISSEVIDNKIADAYDTIENLAKEQQKDRKNSKIKNSILKIGIYGFGAVAAAFCFAFLVFLADPVFAARLPLIGGVFSKIANIYPNGGIPEEHTVSLSNNGLSSETVSVNHSEEEQSGISNNTANLYNNQDTFQGITITYTEYYASNQSVFLGIQIESEEVFPELVTFPDGFQLIQAGTLENYSFREDSPVDSYREIYGKLENENTFVGIMRIPYKEIDRDYHLYEEACMEAEANGEELPGITAENQEEYVTYHEITEEFDLDIQISWLKGYTNSDIPHWEVQGEWNCNLFIEQDLSETRTISIQDVNEEGYGVSGIVISSVELKVYPIEPAGAFTFTIVLDREGRQLDYGASGSTNDLSISGRDISEVSIYVCDYYEWMDELRGYREQEDFQEIMEERALYSITVDTTE